MTTKLTLSDPGHGFEPGHAIALTEPDRRWWRILLFRLLRRGEPRRTRYYYVARVDGCTLTLGDEL